MWCLKFENSAKMQYLLVGKVYTIGRKGADITVSDDSSISRKHGSIEIKLNDQNRSWTVTITDNSKFGTYYARNSTAGSKPDFVKVNKSAIVKEGDLIRIGMQNTLCKLIREPLTVVTSMMDQPTLTKLQSVVNKLGGELSNAWKQTATYLAINHVILNVKVTQALANATPLVTDTFFENFLEAIETEADFPSAKDFVPPIVEEGLDSDKSLLVSNPSRKSLFKDRVFVFLNKKQLKRLGQTCTAAGARALLGNTIAPSERIELLESINTAVLLPPSVPEAPLVLSEEEFADLQQNLDSKGLRFIQEHEIGLALLYNSADVYTNPAFELTADITFTQPTIPGGSMSEAKDSISGMESQIHETLFISRVPETVQCDLEPSTSGECLKKRSHAATLSPSDSAASEAPAKSIKLVQKSSEQVTDIFNNFETQKRVSKPAPKRRPPSKLSSPSSKTAKITYETVKQELLDQENSNLDAIRSQYDNPSDDMPDSCIADDSLWSCKADSQQVVKNADEDVCSKMSTFREKNGNKLPKDHAISEQKTGSWKIVPKKAFTPSTVPDEEDLNALTKFDPDLPCVICTVLTVPLVKQKTSTMQENVVARNRTNGKNFKKFTKVVPAYKNPGSQTSVRSTEPPRIIGGRDLVRHTNQIERASSHAIDMLDGWNTSVQNSTMTHALDSQDVNPFA